MNILFITRKFPPMKGGMEKAAFELYNNLSKKSNVKLLSYSGPNSFLPLVLPYFLFRALWDLSTKRIDVIYLQDGLLSPLGVLFKFTGKSVAVTIHGLDIRYKNPLYQYVIPKCVKKLDKVICVSNMTKEECIRKGVSPDKIMVIHNGISDEYFIKEKNKELRKELNERINISIYSEKILLSVGRLIERKGIHWFVEKVMPRLIKENKKLIYIIVGE